MSKTRKLATVKTEDATIVVIQLAQVHLRFVAFTNLPFQTAIQYSTAQKIQPLVLNREGKFYESRRSMACSGKEEANLPRSHEKYASYELWPFKFEFGPYALSNLQPIYF